MAFRKMNEEELQAHYKALDESWVAYKDHGDEGAKTFIWQSYVPLVDAYARRFSSKSPILDQDDLRQAGLRALLTAIERFDHTRGVSFSEFAKLRINGAIIDEINEMDWTPRAMRQIVRKTLMATQRLESSGVNEPTDEQIAKEAKLSVEDVRVGAMQAHKTHVNSISNDTIMILEGTGAPGNYTSYANSSTTNTPMAIDQLHHRLELFSALREVCTEEQREVLYLHYFEELTLSEVGERLGFSASKASALKRGAINALRKHYGKNPFVHS